MPSKIEWTEETWNPISGCTRISRGCDNCYIERTIPFRMARRRFDKPGIGGTTGVLLHPNRLDWPLKKWTAPTRIFIPSLADLFHDDVPLSLIEQVFAVIARTLHHTYQLPTKRPARMSSILRRPTFRDTVAAIVGADIPWPLPNLWLGVSVEDQAAANLRIPALLDTPAAVRWLSCEPLLGPVDLRTIPFRGDVPYLIDPLHRRYRTQGPPTDGWGTTPFHSGMADLGGIDWVVVGGETGPGARPMYPDWARAIRDQCTAAGVPFFFKQWGDWAPIDDTAGWQARRESDWYVCRDGFYWPLAEPHGAEDGTEVLIRRVGKKVAGRQLDGREWDEYPTAVAV